MQNELLPSILIQLLYLSVHELISPYAKKKPMSYAGDMLILVFNFSIFQLSLLSSRLR